MNKSVAVYYASVPAKNTKTEKVLVLSNFATGVKPSGDTLIEEKSATFYPTDLAVIQGWVHEDSQSAPHLNFRRHVILEQRKAGKHTLAIDSNLFLYRDPQEKSAIELLNKMTESYGKKTVSKLIDRAKSVVDLLIKDFK